MNKIIAYLEFSFKGENIKLETELSLDELMKKHRAIPPLHQHLATLHNIDSYSYQYEMIFGEKIQFSHAEGDAVDFLQGQQFDQDAFEQHWYEQELFDTLAPLIKQQLEIDDINQHPKFKSIVIAAYKAGKENTN